MKKTLLPLGVLILVVSLLLAVVGPISAAGAGQVKILKKDQDGNALVGATFVISPNAQNFSAEDLIVVDNGINDDDSTNGVLLIINCTIHPSIEYTVTETVAPPGFTPAPPQKIIIPSTEIVTLTFINTPVVGGEAQAVNTAGVVIPWISLALVGIAGIFIALKRRLHQSKRPFIS